MGWSCGANASKVEDAWREGCRKQTGSSNSFLNKNNIGCFFETSRREHRDGAITGTIYRNLPCGTKCVKVGTFRIEGNGEITRAPKTLIEFAAEVTKQLKVQREQSRGNPFVTKVAY